MANVREYTSPEEARGINPGDMGAGAKAEAGRFAQRTAENIGNMFGSDIARAGNILEKHQQQADDAAYLKEITTGAATEATLEDNLNARWEEIQKNTDPANWNAARQNFLDTEVTPAIDNYQSSFETDRGKLYAARQGASLTKQFYRTTAADSANGAGLSVVSNLNTVVNTSARSVYNHPDTLDDALTRLETAADAAVAGTATSGEDAAKVKNDIHVKGGAELVKAAINGMIAKDPVGFLARYENGDFEKYAGYLGADGMAAAKNAAQAAIKSNDAAKKAADASQTKQDKENYNSALIDLQSEQYDENGNIHLKPDYFEKLKQLNTMPGASPATARTMLAWGQKLLNNAAATKNDPETFEDFSKRMFLPDDDPNKLTAQEVYEAAAAGQIVPGEKGLKMFLGALSLSKKGGASGAGPVETRLINSATKLYDPPSFSASGVFPSPGDFSRAKAYKEWFLPALMAGLQSGKSVQDLTDPASPDYLPKQYDPTKAATDQPLMYPGSRGGSTPTLPNGGSPANLPPLGSPGSPFGGGGLTAPAAPTADEGEPEPTTPPDNNAPAPTGEGRVFERQSGATYRTQPISPDLSKVLVGAATDADVKVQVFSGGQSSNEPGQGTGSTRHNGGNAADIYLYKDGRRLSPNDPNDLPTIQSFVRTAIANGATGIGIGKNGSYMGDGIHVGFGPNGEKGGRVTVWGARGKGINAPDWLKELASG